jgi:hypothetical protein
MLARPLIAAAAGLLAIGCATAPATAPAGPAPEAAPAAEAPAASITVENAAATTRWIADERLLPQDPILALVAQGGSVSAPAGFSMTCNPDNGDITARLGRQLANRAGQEAAYTLRLGAAAERLDGRFVPGARAGDVDFVFSLEPVTLRTMAQLNSVSIVTDGGEVQWTFLRDPAEAPNARYIASLRDLNTASEQFLVFCNPK